MARTRLPLPPACAITAEQTFHRRRELLRGALGALPLTLLGCHKADAEGPDVPARPLRGVVKGSYNSSEPPTAWRDATHYNNYYEFGTGKSDPARQAVNFKPRPWTVTIAGHCKKVGRFDLDELLKPHALEERIYRMRCVEGWSMVIPWDGFPLADLIDRCEPSSNAKYVAFTSLQSLERMPGQQYAVLDWPYREGLRMDEAMNPLTLIATGVYGRELPNQNGAPLRLVVPWKYGFKGIKAIVKIEFLEKPPATSWNQSAPDEYGFFANVNPAVDHPRWSQATERRIAGNSLLGNRIATLPFNGYAEQVAGLYAGMDLGRYF